MDDMIVISYTAQALYHVVAFRCVQFQSITQQNYNTHDEVLVYSIYLQVSAI